LTQVALGVVMAGRNLLAQDGSPGAVGGRVDGAAVPLHAAWLEGWSPLRAIADLGRHPHRAPAPRGVDVPRTGVGPFLLAGAPGAIATDVARLDSIRWGYLGASDMRETGAFRRPFDPVQSVVQAVMGIGWQPVGKRGRAMGAFSVDRERQDPGGLTSRVTPYSASPFVLADSATPTMERARVRLEGALGGHVGGWSGGLSAGVDARQHNSVDSPVRRTARQAVPAVAGGVERAFGGWGRLGLFGRWTEQVETQQLTASPGSATYYAVRGVARPVPYLLAGASVLARVERRASAHGLTASVRAMGADLVAVWETSQRTEDQFLAPFQAQRPTDRWRPRGQSLRTALQRPFARHGRLQVTASHETLSGEATRGDLTGLAVQVEERRQALEAEVRWRWRGMDLLGFGGVIRHDRTVVDFVAQVEGLTQRTTPFSGVEAFVRHGGWGVTAGASHAASQGSGRLPILAQQDATYGRLVAPDLAYEVATVSAWSGWLRLAHQVAGKAADLTVRVDGASPVAVDMARAQPGGQRRRLTVGIGVRP
jgi:hypothetical protein